MFLHVDGSTFFIDNEYFGDRMSGYTLPGFVLQPKVEWRLHDKVTLSGGFHWLYYWGARDYPATTAYGAYPLYDSVSHPLHLLPWLQARIDLTSELTLVLGCLNAFHHNLPFPLYNHELGDVGDPETGFEIKYLSRRITMDIWADWREYIWDRSPVPERFTAGASGTIGLVDERQWSLSVPVHFVVQHEGGQNMSVPHNINNNFNGAAGLEVSKSWTRDLWTGLSCRAFWYHQHGNAAVPFSNGWAIYPEFIIHPNNNWAIAASYWHGKDFVPLMGSWHYSNLSANTPGLTFDHTRVIMLYANWGLGENPLTTHYLRFYGTLYHYLPSTGTFADGTTKEYGHRNQIAFGAILSFFPKVKLH